MTSQPSRPRLSRRGLLTSALALTGAGALAACSSGTASQALNSGGPGAGGALTIGLTYTPNIQFAPFYMALANKDYESTVELRHHGGSEGLFDALLAGTEHMVIAGADEAAVAASNGSPLVVIGGYYQGYPGCVIAREDSAVASLADLKGRVVGLPGRMGENWYALQVAMRNAGLTESDLTILEIGFTQQAALAQPKSDASDTSKPDAIIGFSNNDAVGLKESGVAVRTIPVGDDIPLIGASLVTTQAVLEARRAELNDAVMASSRGMAGRRRDRHPPVRARPGRRRPGQAGPRRRRGHGRAHRALGNLHHHRGPRSEQGRHHDRVPWHSGHPRRHHDHRRRRLPAAPRRLTPARRRDRSSGAGWGSSAPEERGGCQREAGAEARRGRQSRQARSSETRIARAPTS